MAKSAYDSARMGFSDKYVVHEKLGEGGQATVYRAVQRDPPGQTQSVAVKVYVKTGVDADVLEDLQEDLRLEVSLLKQLEHLHIVSLLESHEDARRVYLVQELLDGGDLFDYLLARGALTESNALAVFTQLALAVEYLHGLSIAHRDIKTENVVFKRRGAPHVKLVDFGTADRWTPQEPLTGLLGTPAYMAPEVVRGWYWNDDVSLMPTYEPYGLSCDLWSMYD